MMLCVTDRVVHYRLAKSRGSYKVWPLPYIENFSFLVDHYLQSKIPAFNEPFWTIEKLMLRNYAHVIL